MDSPLTPPRVFIHGLESSSRGEKATFFRERYPDMIVEDYVGTFEERMTKLGAVLADKDNLIVVGSSMGGLMAAVFACLHPEKIRKLVLLAPALNYLPAHACRGGHVSAPVLIYHGSRDEVVPYAPVEETARRLFPHLDWRLVVDDHSLHQTFFRLPWDELLACD